MKKITLLYILFSLFWSVVLMAQPFNHQTGTPSIPSAAAMNYGAFADVPAHLPTGTISASVPITTLTEGPLSHTVSINYQSVIRATDLPSAYGLGWHGSAGGIISRVIVGIEDDDKDNKGFYHSGDQLSTNHVVEVNNGERDSESDVYTYSFGAFQGKFVLNKYGWPQSIPQSDLRIRIELHPTFDTFKGFEIRTPDGTRYYFGYKPGTTQTAYENTFVNNNSNAQRTAWFLMRIESADELHTIDFNYINTNYQFKTLPFLSDVAYHSGGRKFVSSGSSSPNWGNPDPIEHDVYSSILSSITTTTTSVAFEHFTRSDLYSIGGSPHNPLGMDKIKVHNGSYCVEYDLIHSYFVDPSESGPGGKRLKLDEVRKKACNSSLSEPAWAFEYHGHTNADGTHFFPKYLTKDLDHWNFYNYSSLFGSNDMDEDLIPSSTKVTPSGSYIQYGSSNRSTNENATLKGVLKKVTYPTGGFTEYTYESNTYMDHTVNPLHAFSIESCDTDCGGSQSEQTTLELKGAMINSGRLNLCLEAFDDIPGGGFDPNNNFAKMEIRTSTGQLFYSYTFNSTINLCKEKLVNKIRNYPSGNYLIPNETYTFKVTSFNARAILHLNYSSPPVEKPCGGLRIAQTRTHDGIATANDIVRTYEYKKANSTENSGILFNQPQYAFILNDYSVLFASSSIIPLSSLEGYHLNYTRVVIYEEDCSFNCGTVNGYTEHLFNTEGSSAVYEDYPVAPVEARVLSGTLSEQHTWRGGTTPLLEASQSILRFESDDYSTIAGQTYKAQKVTLWDGSAEVQQNIYTEYRHQTGIFRLGEVTTTLDGLSTTTSYDYHPTDAVLAPTKISISNSDGKVTENRTTYTVDHPDNDMRDDFIGANMLVLPYQTSLWVDGQQVDGNRTNYSYFNCAGEPISSFSCHPPKAHQMYRYERTWTNGVLQSGNWSLEATILKYTSEGLVKEYQQSGWQKESYTYQNKLKTGSSYLNFSKTYTYYPNSSLLQTLTEVDGTSTTIVYDDLMRAESITDNCKNIVKDFVYHFADGTPGDKNYVETTTDYPLRPHGSQQYQRHYHKGVSGWFG